MPVPQFIEPKEIYWFHRCSFLETVGYRLRPKFHPGFVATQPSSKFRFEDELTPVHARRHIMDAERISDGKHVMLKCISKSLHPFEVEIATFFGSPPLVDSPRNHVIPVLEVLQDPGDADRQILVMPRLMEFDRPIFDTVGEVIDCFRQIFEGIQFMHENFVAHRDCGLLNFVLDPEKLFPHGTHPINVWATPTNDALAYHTHRTACWPRYYIIDFGLSRRYDPANGPPLEDVIRGADKSPPEHRGTSCNPFPTDIYFLGNMLREDFLQSHFTGLVSNHAPLRFLKPLINDMIQTDPALRPTIGEVIQRFDARCARLSRWHLRRPGQAHDLSGWIDNRLRQIKNSFNGVPPLPARSPTRPFTQLDDTMRSFYTKTPGHWRTRDSR
ncbi:hypothetical protein B0H17DRAFT_955399 [Mycena rosella]|uniref:Protein kinase domain-containing protein n=1 Tax=Mycena rosella TaxID=1033263 RepID=A0AAD7CQC2_MYCRO|nr:hypothetical protein B0H17DRAFT_955399 [Mycena rosella]